MCIISLRRFLGHSVYRSTLNKEGTNGGMQSRAGNNSASCYLILVHVPNSNTQTLAAVCVQTRKPQTVETDERCSTGELISP